MSQLTIRLTKRRDGSVVLACTRPDGSVTWQRHEGPRGRFFPRHDLTHLAVETVLRYRRGFYGLVAEGWNLTDFGSPWPRGPLPADADPAELIVGFLDAEGASGVPLSAAEANHAAVLHAAGRSRREERPPGLTEEDLRRIRERRRELFGAWDALVPGETLELPFVVPARED